MLFKILCAGVQAAAQERRRQKYAKAEKTLATLNSDGSKKQVVVVIAEPVSKQ